MTSSEHMEQREGCYYIPGTRISLDSIVYAFREGCSPESIREDFDGLPLASVYGAIAFYLDHQAEMDSYLLSRKAQWAELDRLLILTWLTERSAPGRNTLSILK